MLPPKIIYGPPGTGKTRTLMEMINEYVQSRSDAHVLFCSHTRAAAQEAASRWGAGKRTGKVDLQTIHATCFRAFSMSKAQTVDDGKLRDFGEEFGIEFGYNDVGREYLEVFAVTQVTGCSLVEAYDRSSRPGTAAHFTAFATSYQQWKQSFGYKDFNDMLVRGTEGFHGSKLAPYNMVVIDEAQDLTPLHWRVIERLYEELPGAQFLIALDDDQTIFAWQGADPHGAEKFCEVHHGSIQVLEQSWRIPKKVYWLADQIIRRVRKRQEKNYRPRDADGQLVRLPSYDHLEFEPGRDNLVLFADRFIRKEVEGVLQSRYVPYSAIAGFPAPLDTRGGKAYRIAMLHSIDEILDNDDLRYAVKSGLSKEGQYVWDQINATVVLRRIKRRDLGDLALFPTQRDYLQHVELSPGPGRVRISTFHGAKGMEADDVHLILSISQSAWQQSFTDPDSLHRLFYTAVTRARERLFIYDGESAYEMPELSQGVSK